MVRENPERRFLWYHHVRKWYQGSSELHLCCREVLKEPWRDLNGSWGWTIEILWLEWRGALPAEARSQIKYNNIEPASFPRGKKPPSRPRAVVKAVPCSLASHLAAVWDNRFSLCFTLSLFCNVFLKLNLICFRCGVCRFFSDFLVGFLQDL